MRESEKEYNTAMNNSLLEILNLSGTSAEKYKQIESFQGELGELWNRLDSLKHEVYPNQPAYIACQLSDFLNELDEKIKAPFTGFIVVDKCCVISSNQNQMSLSNGNIGRVVIYIVIKSETEFFFEIHIMQDENGWLDDDAVFEEAIMKNEALHKYLTDNFAGQNKSCYVRSGSYKNITDLEETITNWIEELRKFF